MSKNCEIIEMIGSSQNTNLLGVGESVFDYAGVGGFSVQASKAVSLTFTILTPGVTFTNSPASGQTVQTIAYAGASGERAINVSGACKISITNDKYILSKFIDNSGYLKIDLSQLEYAVGLERLLLRGLNSNALSTGDISSLKNCPALIQLTILSPEVDGDVAELPNNPFISIVFSGNTDAEHANVYGNISSFSRYTTLTALDVRNTQVSGSLNSMLDAMYNSGNGRTSGTLTIKAQGSGVLYNGNPITTELIATFSSSGWSIA